MLKYEGMFSVGDRVRAYDFQPIEGREERYAQGTIVETGFFDGVAGYRILVEEDSVFKKDPRQEIVAPYEVLFLEYDGRIIRV